LIYNLPGYQSGWTHLAVPGPRTPSAGSHIPTPARADDGLQMRGNLVWNGPPDYPLGIEEAEQGCQPSNPTCNEAQLRTENSINRVEPRLANPVGGDFRPAPGSVVYTATTYALPAFPGGDRPQPPLAPAGVLSNIVDVDRAGKARPAFGPPGAYAGVSTAQVGLVAGWNLVSLPLNPVHSAITSALASLAGHYDQVYAYDAWATGDPWQVYSPDAPLYANTLSDVNTRQGLWIRAREAVTLSVTGTLPLSSTIALKAGWNLVGYPSSVTQPIMQALNGLAPHYDLVFAYDARDRVAPWRSYAPNAPSWANDLTALRPGGGYWVRVREDCVWTVE
jgi:hypothetical protein